MRRLLLGVITFVASCSGRDATAPPAPARVESVTIRSSSNSNTLPIDGVFQLDVSVRDAGNNPLENRPVSFTSSAAGIATVDAKGLVIGVAPGDVTITATIEGKRGEIALQVVGPVHCGPALLANCTRADEYVLLLVDGQSLPVKSPYGAGDWDDDEDAGTWRLTAAVLRLYRDGAFENVVTHRAASGTSVNQSFGGRFTRSSSTSFQFAEGPLAYRGELAGDRLTMTFANGQTFTWQASSSSAGK